MSLSPAGMPAVRGVLDIATEAFLTKLKRLEMVFACFFCPFPCFSEQDENGFETQKKWFWKAKGWCWKAKKMVLPKDAKSFSKQQQGGRADCELDICARSGCPHPDLYTTVTILSQPVSLRFN